MPEQSSTTAGGCQVTFQGKHYDIPQSWLDAHPGGANSILSFAGRDMTDAFVDVGHSKDALAQLSQYEVCEVTYKGRKFRVPTPWIRDSHPGGADAILIHEGGDITAAFADVGHSDEAVAMLEQWVVPGQAAPAEVPRVVPPPPAATSKNSNNTVAPPTRAPSQWIPIAVGVAVAAVTLVAYQKLVLNAKK